MRFAIALLFAASMSAQTLVVGGAGSGGGGGGQYSTASAAYTAGTFFFPPGGGLAGNATEANVQGAAAVTGTVSNFQVALSAAPGIGVTVVFTWRKAGVDQAVTCTVSGASAKTCSDTAHNFGANTGDLLSIKAVVSGGTATAAVVMTWGLPGQQGPMGPSGPTGPTGPTGTAGTSVNWKGTYSAGTTYALNDGVTDGSASYVSIQVNNLAHTPSTSPTFWQLIAQQGAQGPAGAAGTAGATGPAGTSVNWKGSFASGTTYAANDGVTDGASSYVSLSAGNVGHTPSASPTFWQLIAQQGAQGPAGSAGAAGTAGANGQGVPVGGTTNQLLQKSSNTDFATVWADNAGGSPAAGATNDFQLNGGAGVLGAAPLAKQSDGSVSASKTLTWAAATKPTFNAAGTTTCDLSLSNLCEVDFGAGNTTLALSNPHGSGPYWLRSCQDATGGRTYTFPATAKGFAQPDGAAGTTNCTEQVFSYDGTNYQGGAASVPTSAWHGIGAPEGTAPNGLASTDFLYALSSSHRFAMNPNAAGAILLVGITSAAVAGNCAKFAANGIDVIDAGATCGTGGGGGGTAAYTTVAFSGTPTFTVTASTSIQNFKITLTANVTGSTLTTTSATTGQDIAFTICQDGTGGRTFVWPTNVLNHGTIDGTLNGCSNQVFRYDGTNALAVAPMTVTGLSGSDITLAGSTSGTIDLVPAATAGANTITVPALTGTMAVSGVDLNASSQVTATHLSAALPVNQGGTGTTSTLSGIVRGGSPMTAGELTGDVTSTVANATTVRTPLKSAHLGGVATGAENASAALATGDIGIHGFVINDTNAKTLTEASCISDAGTQSIVVKHGATTLFTINCVAPGSYSRVTTDGTTGYIVAASMAVTAVGSGDMLDQSGTANGSTKSTVLHLYGTVN